jgi:hypothetical protein
VSAALKEGELPLAGLDVVTHEVEVAIVPAELEIPMVGAEPLIEYLRHLDAALAELKRARCFFSTMAGLAFDRDGQQRRLVHRLACAHRLIIRRIRRARTRRPGSALVLEYCVLEVRFAPSVPT